VNSICVQMGDSHALPTCGIFFSVYADVPMPPDIAGIDSQSGPPGGRLVSAVVPAALDFGSIARTAQMHTGRRRICGRRVVALGQKPLLVGGIVEGTAFRHFAAVQVRWCNRAVH
jgi:hypothetical protein